MDNTIGSYISGIYAKIEKRYRICFFSALICGLMAHIYALTNHLYNYDELWHTPAGFGTGTEVGRWSLSVTVWIQKRLFGDCYTIPFLNGFLTIVLYSLAACFVVSVIDVSDEFYACVIGALMTTFPAFTSRMFFMFTTHYYAIGIAMVAVGVWIFTKRKQGIWNTIVSVALVIYGMAIYQANFVTGVCMLVAYLLVQFIKEDTDFKTAIRKSVNSVLYLGICMGAFLISSKVALAVTGKQMETYENLDTMGQLSVSQAVEGVIRCYKTFFKLPFKDVYSMNPNIIVRVTFLLTLLVLVYTVICVWSSNRNIINKVFVSLIILVLPIAVNLIVIMAIASGTMYSIMVYEIVFALIVPISCLEALRNTGVNSDEESSWINQKVESIKRPVNVITALALFATVVTYIWFSNGNYLAMEYTNNHDNAYYQVLMTQIKSVDGYRDDMPVATIGKPTHDNTNSRQSMIGGTFNIGGKGNTNVNAYSSWNIMTRVLGFDPVFRDSDEDETSFANNPKIKNMPNYPDDGSIRVIDDTVIVKFQDIEELGW